MVVFNKFGSKILRTFENMELFKYCDKNGVNILKYKALKLSTIGDFNDPFEFKIAKSNNALLDNGLNAVYEYQKNLYRVLCFTSNENNIIMWSHYSNNHTGILIKFQTDNIFVDDRVLSECIECVDYKEEMIKLPENFLELNYENQGKIVKKNTFRKFIDWDYEKEYRAMILFDIAENNRYIEINTNAIIEVILGYKCDLQTELDCINILKTREYKHVKLKKAILDEEFYKMKYYELQLEP
jgi:hypothetical protein